MLEFVGDSILAWKIALFLFQKKDVKTPEKASLAKSLIVGNEHLSEVSCNLELPNFVLKSKGAVNLEKRTKTQSDLFESLCAAIYLANEDKGSEELDKFLNTYLYGVVDKYLSFKTLKNPVTVFQEKIQNTYRHKAKIYYDTKFNADCRLYNCELSITVLDGEKIVFGRGTASTKKIACLHAAKEALKTGIEI